MKGEESVLFIKDIFSYNITKDSFSVPHNTVFGSEMKVAIYNCGVIVFGDPNI